MAKQILGGLDIKSPLLLSGASGTSGQVLTSGGSGTTPTWTTISGGAGGTVTSVSMTVPTGLSISGSPITSSGTLALSLTSGYSIPTTASQTNWDTAYSERAQWDGGSTNLVAATGRTSLGATTVGSNLFTLTNPSAVTFLRVNADNTVTARSAANTRTDLGLGTMALETASNYTQTLFHTPVANYTIGTTTTAGATISGSAFSKTPTLSSSITYFIEAVLYVQSTIGSGTGSNLVLGWNSGGGGGVGGNIQLMVNAGLAALTTSSTTTTSIEVTNLSNTTLITSPAGTQITKVVAKGIVRSGGVPSYTIYPTWSVTNSSTPGVPTSLTTLVGSYLRFIPLTAAGSDVSVGAWA